MGVVHNPPPPPPPPDSPKHEHTRHLKRKKGIELGDSLTKVSLFCKQIDRWKPQSQVIMAQ